MPISGVGNRAKPAGFHISALVSCVAAEYAPPIPAGPAMSSMFSNAALSGPFSNKISINGRHRERLIVEWRTQFVFFVRLPPEGLGCVAKQDHFIKRGLFVNQRYLLGCVNILAAFRY